MEIIKSFAVNFASMFISMAPYIVLGLVLVGLLNSYIKREAVMKYLGTDKFSSVLLASAVGVPLPLCSCGVVPTAIGLKENGASNGAVVSFLISTPQTGVDSILATYSMMGWFMAIFRPITAFFSGIIGGVIVNIFAKKDKIKTQTAHSCCCGHEEAKVEEHSCCCGHEEAKVEEHSCCCGHEEAKVEESKLKSAMKYSFGGFLDKMAGHFLIGMLLATLIATFIPTDFFLNIGLDSGVVAMLAMVLIGLPMYICSTSSIPIAIALVSKGLSLGCAFVFLVTGPITNIASILVLSKALGKKITAIYTSVVVVVSIFFGLLLDFLTTTFQIKPSFQQGSAIHHAPFAIGISTVFALLIFRSLWKKWRARSMH